MFRNKDKPVHCLSTRIRGVNYRVSMLIGNASEVSKDYIATYNPNYCNKFMVRQAQAAHAAPRVRSRRS